MKIHRSSRQLDALRPGAVVAAFEDLGTPEKVAGSGKFCFVKAVENRVMEQGILEDTRISSS